MKMLQIPYLAFGLSMALLAPASAASYGSRGGGGSYRGGGTSAARSGNSSGSAVRSQAIRSSGASSSLRASSTRLGFTPSFSQRSGSQRFSSSSSSSSHSTRASASQWRGGNHWQGNRNYGSASALRGARDYDHRGDYRRSGNHYSHYGRGYYPYYSYGSFPGYWGGSYSYYPSSLDYPNYYDDGDYYSEDPGYDAAYSRQVYYEANAATASQIQRRLAAEGYYDGSIDGTIGPRMRAAIRAYERDHGLQITGAISKSLLRALRLA